jgi:SAM-dependent methyltransferase
VDVDAEAVDWCNDNIDFASFLTMPFEPPTSLLEATFDAVYANSVFSHLSEPRHLQWLEELHRITRPGAVLILTVQGERVIKAIADERRHGVVPDIDEFTRRIDELKERGFGFFPYRTLPRTAADSFGSLMKWDLTEYGSAFVLEPYVRRVWSQHFEVIAWHAAPEDWQDFVVLRRL